MSTDPVRYDRTPDTDSEARLLEIRREAETRGIAQGRGFRPQDAPFPQASPESGYYGIPLLKQPQWTWEVPLYFFVGGAAAASALIGAMARWTARDKELARDARLVAAGGAIISTGLLVSDLGRPERFLNMLRVFKAQSPMSVGAWVLALFGSASGAAAFAQIVDDKLDLAPVRVLGDVAEGFAAALGLPLATYTGVLIGATAIPAWNHNVKTLPVHFAMSGLASGVSVLELMGHDDSTALNLLGIGAAALESYEGIHLEFLRHPEVNRPLKHGVTGWTTRFGGVLSGPVPLALRLLAAATGSRRLRRIAAASAIAGSILTRYGWVYAGHESARDWRLPLGLREEAQLDQGPMQSKAEIPQARIATDAKSLPRTKPGPATEK
jgi:hypothetical protein